MTEEALLLKILAASERTAAACERLADVADARHHARQQAAPAASEAPRKRAPKGDVLTVTGKVTNFGEAAKKDKNGNPYYVLKLDTGFYANIFSGSDAAICSQAWDEGIPLIVEYVVNGKYSNVESVRMGTGGAKPKAREEEDEGWGEGGAPF